MRRRSRARAERPRRTALGRPSRAAPAASATAHPLGQASRAARTGDGPHGRAARARSAYPRATAVTPRQGRPCPARLGRGRTAEPGPRGPAFSSARAGPAEPPRRIPPARARRAEAAARVFFLKVYIRPRKSVRRVARARGGGAGWHRQPPGRARRPPVPESPLRCAGAGPSSTAGR